MATTTNYGFPSPEGNQAPQGPYAIKALADAVDTALAAASKDSGWQNITVAGGFAPPGTTPPQVRKKGNRVDVRWGWAATGMTASGTFNLGTIPVGYRPPEQTYVSAVSSSGAAVGHFFIFADGHIEIRTGPTLGAYYFMSAGCGWYTD